MKKHLSFNFFLLLALLFMFIPGYSYYRDVHVEQRSALYRELPEWFSTIPVSPYPEKITNEPFPSLTAEGVFVMDADSAVPLYEKNSSLQFYPASTTKIMTGLLVLEEYNRDSVLTVPEATYSGSSMRLFKGERIRVSDLLYGLMVNSGNDAAEVLAHYYEGGRDVFISRMNTRASELGLKNTWFVNPTGLPDKDHKTTAWDLGHLAGYAMRNERFRQLVGTKQHTVYGLNGEKHTLKTTNQLLGVIPGLDGVKTGYTEEAGEVLVSSVVRNGHRIIIVLLKSQDRFGETSAVVEWVFSNHEWREF